MRARTAWGAGLGVSLIVHSAAVVGVGRLAARPAAPPAVVPLGLVEAPPPPPPPKLVEPPPAPPRRVRRRPKRKARPRVKVAVAPRKVPAEVKVALAADAGLPDGATGTGIDAGDGDAGGDVGMDGGVDAGVDGGLDAGLDADLDAGPIDPGVVDLRPSFPPGERVMLVLRTDRLRGTPWAPRLEAILAPMPDQRFLIQGTGLGIVDSFDTVAIASPAPRDVTQTFVAARTGLDVEALKRALARPPPGGSAPRLRWSGGAAERLDPRIARLRDPRLLRMLPGGWFVLMRPESLQGDRSWLESLMQIEAQTGDGPTVAVVTVAGLDTPSLALPLPGLPPLPAPDRLTVALSVAQRGLILTGAAVFADQRTAQAFADVLERTRRAALASLAGRILLRSLRAEGAVRRFATAQSGAGVTFSTSLAAQDADFLLEQVAAMARRYFLGPQETSQNQ